jgi:hypothetical protein
MSWLDHVAVTLSHDVLASPQQVVVLAEPKQLGPVYDQYAHPPMFTLSRFLEATLKPHEKSVSQIVCVLWGAQDGRDVQRWLRCRLVCAYSENR